MVSDGCPDGVCRSRNVPNCIAISFTPSTRKKILLKGSPGSVPPAPPFWRASRTSREPRRHLFRKQLERLQAPVTLQDALAEEEEHLVEPDVAARLIDLATHGVG